MEKTFTIIVYSDSGHAWGKVKRQVLRNLDLEDKISPYSYQLRDNVYLEEDCDLGLLLQALYNNNTRVKFIEKHTDKESRIRSYDSYQHEDTTLA
jgi:hypothetical protein